MGIVLLAVLAVLAAGCTNSPKQEKFPGIVRPSQNGSKLYFRAKAQYAVVRSLDPHGPTLAKAMDSVLGDLDGTVANDPRCPLFFGKRGEMFLELGPDGYARAEQDLKKALELTEDWVPAWIALADLEARRGDAQRAAKWLDGADKSIQIIEDREHQKPTPPFRILGLEIGGEPPKDPNDPALEETQRRQLMFTWLQESEQWTIDSPSLLMPAVSSASPGASGSSGVTVNQSNLIRRFRARVDFEKIVIRLRSGAKPADVLPSFDRVFQWDPDLFPARIEKAVQLRAAGDYRQAERLLRPYIDAGDPKLANNARLLYEMGSIYTDWYINDPKSPDSQQISRLAEQAFTRLHQVNPEHGPGWIERARLYATAGERGRKPTTLKDANQWLDNARQSQGLTQDSDEIRAVREQIDRAQKALQTSGGAG
ncbi:MAG TPA: hypothetical protein VH475_26305 [Tepidisphaeraceae bacterium]